MTVSGTPPAIVRACLIKDVKARRIRNFKGRPARIRCITAGSLMPGTRMTNTDWKLERLAALPSEPEKAKVWARCMAISKDKTLTTVVRARDLSRECIGKTFELSGGVHDVTKFTLYVKIERPGSQLKDLVACALQKDWRARAEALRKGARVRISGRFEDEGVLPTLQPCQLLAEP